MSQQPNFLDQIHQQLQRIPWSVWIPYPSSWIRALLLIPLVVPGTQLIMGGFGIILLATFANHPVALILSTLAGFVLPALLLTLTYYLLWFQWKKPPLLTRWISWWNTSNSLWEGIYGIFVIIASFTLLFFLFALPLSVTCVPSVFVRDFTFDECMARGLARFAKIVLTQTENPFHRSEGMLWEIQGKVFFRHWVVIWLVSSVYLYQAEFLLRKRYTAQRLGKSVLLFILGVWGFAIVSRVAAVGLPTTVTSVPTPIAEVVVTPAPDVTETPSLSTAATLSTPSFESQEIVTPSEESELIEETQFNPSSTANSEPRLVSELDPFREAVNHATEAANRTQTAKLKSDWQEVALYWETAAQLMQMVPESSSNYAIAQDRAIQYQRNLDYAKLAASRAE
ncbi:MAG: hypothetical protein LRZ84_10390 [Desertifilum sp.]|nr:hypothetical protein [Desertifilum sp.]